MATLVNKSACSRNILRMFLIRFGKDSFGLLTNEIVLPIPTFIIVTLFPSAYFCGFSKIIEEI